MSDPMDMLRSAIGDRDFMTKGVSTFLTAYMAAEPMIKIAMVGAFRSKAKAGIISKREALFIAGYIGGCEDLCKELLARQDA